MNETDIIDTGLPMARIADLQVIGPFIVSVTWAEGARSGRTDTVDLSPALGSYKVYGGLRNDQDLFASADLIDDGYAIGWAGSDLDMSAELIEELAEETMTPDDFARFIKRNNLTQDAAAALLGRSRRQIGYYLSPGPVPRIVALACFGYEALQASRRSKAA